MRKKIVIIIIIIILISAFLFIYRMKPTTVCDYDNIRIPEECYQISVEDVNTSIEMYANSISEDCDLSNLNTEEFMNYFSVKTIDELKALAIDNMVQHRVVEYVYEYIMRKSALGNKDSDYCKKYLDTIRSLNQAAADSFELSYEEYIKQYYNMDIDQYTDSEFAQIRELCIMRRILERTDNEVSQEEFYNRYDIIAEDMGIPVSEVESNIIKEDIEYDIALEKVTAILVKDYNDFIEQASKAQKENHNIIGK